MKARKERKVVTMSVMARPCDSCPFEGVHPIAMTPEKRQEVFAHAQQLRGQHYCHSSKDTMLCRGGRNITLGELCSRGLLDEPTDEAFRKRSQEILGEQFHTNPSSTEG